MTVSELAARVADALRRDGLDSEAERIDDILDDFLGDRAARRLHELAQQLLQMERPGLASSALVGELLDLTRPIVESARVSDTWYASFRDLATELARAGFERWGTALEDALAAAATGTEAQMALRFHLDTMLREEAGLPVALRRQARVLVRKLNRNLSS